MKPEINLELFASKIKEKIGDMPLRKAVAQIGSAGISAATLQRAGSGKLPDLNTFIRICRWLDLPADTFVVKKMRIKNAEYTTAVMNNMLKLKAGEKVELPTGPITSVLGAGLVDGKTWNDFIEKEEEPEKSEATRKFVDNLREDVLGRFFIPHQQPEDMYGTMHDEAPQQEPFSIGNPGVGLAENGLTRPHPYLTAADFVKPADEPRWVQNLDAILPDDAMADMKGTETPDHNFFEPEEPFEKRHMPFADAKRGLGMVNTVPATVFCPRTNTSCSLQLCTEGISCAEMDAKPTDEIKDPVLFIFNEGLNNLKVPPYTMAITPEGEDEKIPLEVSPDDLDWLIAQNTTNEPRQCPVTNDQCGQGCLPGEPCCLKKPSGPDDSECTLPDLSDDEPA